MPRGQKKRWLSPDDERLNQRRENRPRHPPGLKGKAIGMYYRDLNLQKNSETQKEGHHIKFAIARSVVKRLSSLLEDIYKTDQGSKLKTKFQKAFGDSVLFQNQPKGQETECNEFKVPEATTKKSDSKLAKEATNADKLLSALTSRSATPSTSSSATDTKVTTESTDSMIDVAGPSTLDFIPLKREVLPQECYNFIPLRESGFDFKFGYNDIISGTFEEKLNICISNHKIKSVSNTNETHYNEYCNMVRKEKYQRMLSFRTKLPTYKMAKELIHAIHNNKVLVISGETGCGKSTQVPQIILDDAIVNRKGASTRIIVTQPRRIAASSLAARVADERAEPMGKSVGYTVRLERIDANPECSITFCTTGVLLSELETNQGLTNYSHIILDEVHERDINVDLTMCMIRQILEKRDNLKLILMSATLDAERLSSFFNGCPLIHIEGLAYPVEDIYLEQILSFVDYTLPPMDWDKIQIKRRAEEMKMSIKYKAEVGPWLEEKKHQLPTQVYRTLLDHRIELYDVQLLVSLLRHICQGDLGAILVFLPGIAEISSLLKEMENSGYFPKAGYYIYPLHSKLASLEQKRIFDRPPSHVRKIIVATNIAETSITIDDIVYVVDCAKIKVKGLSVEDNVPTLKVEWVTQANLRQRRGRAGRCQPGVCFHLLTTFRSQNLAERMLPELQRSDLLEPVLTIKKLRLGKADKALTMVPDPPALSTIERAISHLKQCGALNDQEILTPLGWHLARIPAHPSAGKLLIFGSLFGCIDRAASVAAVWGFKDPFQLVIGKEDLVDKAKRSFTLGEPSDHVAVSEAIYQWERAGYGRRSFAYQYFLSNNTLELLVDMKRQFADNLQQMGFLTSGDLKNGWENRNKDNISLFKAVVAASLYPNIATVRWSGLNNHRKHPRISVKLPEGKVSIHPSSVMGIRYDRKRIPARPLCENPGANWLTYWLKQRSKELFLIDVNLVYTLPLLLFGELVISGYEDKSNDCLISIASYQVRCQKETICLLFELRALLDHVLANKVSSSSANSLGHKQFEEKVLNAVIEIITAEDEQTEYISDEESSSDISYCVAKSKHKEIIIL